jgi:acyl-CoA thioesterase-2
VLAFAADESISDNVLVPHGVRWTDDGLEVASLDHAMWFHRPFRADEWLLYHQKSPSAYGARGLAEGFIYTRDGRLAITVIQEGLLRPVGRRDGSGRAGGKST